MVTIFAIHRGGVLSYTINLKIDVDLFIDLVPKAQKRIFKKLKEKSQDIHPIHKFGKFQHDCAIF